MIMLMASCRLVGGATKFGELTYYRVEPNNPEPREISLQEFTVLAGAKPFVMVHGFREQVTSVTQHFQDVTEKLMFVNDEERYSAVIMFTWPSGVNVAGLITSWVSFKKAQGRIRQASECLGSLLQQLPPMALYGHSLGCAVILQAVHYLPDNRCTFAMLAGAACPPEWLANATCKAATWVVLYSQEDNVLKWMYTITNSGKRPLGFVGYVGPRVYSVQFHCSHSEYHLQPDFPVYLKYGE